MTSLLQAIGLVVMAIGLKIVQSLAFAIIVAVLHVLEMAFAMHALGWNQRGLAVVCIAYGVGVFFAVRRAVP